jgi:uncharacterized pyridoxal phosphate-containing UPF0001 family protein
MFPAKRAKAAARPMKHWPCAAPSQRCPACSLRGLMTIPEPSDDPAAQRAPFRNCAKSNNPGGRLPLDTLSMGMSHDLEAAVAEGATIVRIGTAIFGERNYA